MLKVTVDADEKYTSAALQRRQRYLLANYSVSMS